MRYFSAEMGTVEFEGLKGEASLHLYLDMGSEHTLPSIEIQETFISFDDDSIEKTGNLGKTLTPLETPKLFGEEKIQEFMMQVWKLLEPKLERWGDETLLHIRSLHIKGETQK